jgi:hypothetical protein
MFDRLRIRNSPLFGYGVQGLYFLIYIFLINKNVLDYSITNFTLLFFYTSIFSQIINLGNNLSISYFLPKDNDRNYAPYILYSFFILSILTIFALFSQFLIAYESFLFIDFYQFILLVYFISLNKILISIILSIKNFLYYFYFSIFKIIFFFIAFFVTRNLYEILISVEISFFLLQFIFLHVRFFYNYSFNFKKLQEFVKHGIRVFWGNFLYDFLFKIDLLIFSFYLPMHHQDELSLSIIFFEYYYQIIYVIRLSSFTEITKYYTNSIMRDRNNFSCFIDFLKVHLLNYKNILISISIGSLLLLFILKYFNHISYLTFCNSVFLVLGVMVTRFGHVYQLVFNQIGYPLMQSLYFLSTTILVIFIYYAHINIFSSDYIYISSFFSTLLIGYNVKLFLNYFKYYESDRIKPKEIL